MFTEKKEKMLTENPNEILMRCLRNEDISEWNEWRYQSKWTYTSLKGVDLGSAGLAGADFSNVNLEMANLDFANLAGADLSEANLARADLGHANLMGADLWKADLKFANLWETNLKNARLNNANLENARLVRVNLESADLWKANLKGAKFISIVVDRRTFIWGCNFDEQTLFSGRGLSKARIEPRLIDHMMSI